MNRAVVKRVRKFLDDHWDEWGDIGSHYLIRRKLFLNGELRRSDLNTYLGKRGEFGRIWLKLRSLRWVEEKLTRFRGERRDLLRREEMKKILSWEEGLVRWNFAKELFGENYGKELFGGGGKSELEQLIKLLLQEKRSLEILSSYGVNVIMLGVKLLNWNKLEVISRLLKVWDQMGEDNVKEVGRKLYFWTHLVIGSGGFYTGEIEDEEKRLLIAKGKVVEGLVKRWWSDLSLDVRLEVGVAFRLLGEKLEWEEVILNKATENVSLQRGYVEDLRRGKRGKIAKLAEHRSVLYLILISLRQGF